MSSEFEKEDWIREFGSDTLRRAMEEDMCWYELYLHERTAFEIGYGFEPVHASCLTLGPAIAAPDDPATTETCWWARALRWRGHRDRNMADIQVKYITIASDEGTREGIGLTYKPQTWPDWLLKNRVLVAITWDEKNKRTINPC